MKISVTSNIANARIGRITFPSMVVGLTSEKAFYEVLFAYVSNAWVIDLIMVLLKKIRVFK